VELKQIKELMAAMGKTGIKRLTVKKDTFELTLEHEEASGIRSNEVDFLEESLKQVPPWMRAEQAFSRGSDMPATRPHSPIAQEAAAEETNSAFITSPMVGTFYSSPSPEDPSFIKVGEKIDKNTVVCIVEAMKVMNEIKANVAGTVAEVLIESGQPVEFGTKLFRITE
jgi:acetyl-CoA carboxylase biotin carboxyl carrier protein